LPSEQEQEESAQDTNDQHHELDEDDEERAFNEEEIQNLRDIFDLFDKDQVGKIQPKDLESILTSLKRDVDGAREFLSDVQQDEEGAITFDEFLKLMIKVENRIDKKDQDEGEGSSRHEGASDGAKDGAKRTALIDFLVLLEDYREKCESEGKYAEARK